MRADNHALAKFFLGPVSMQLVVMLVRIHERQQSEEEERLHARLSFVLGCHHVRSNSAVDLATFALELDLRSKKCCAAVALVLSNDQHWKESLVVDPVVEYFRACSASEWLPRDRYVGHALPNWILADLPKRDRLDRVTSRSGEGAHGYREHCCPPRNGPRCNTTPRWANFSPRAKVHSTFVMAVHSAPPRNRDGSRPPRES